MVIKKKILSVEDKVCFFSASILTFQNSLVCSEKVAKKPTKMEVMTGETDFEGASSEGSDDGSSEGEASSDFG